MTGGRTPARFVAAIIVALFALITLPLILTGGGDAGDSRAVFDQNEFHLPVVRQFAETWPLIDVRDYASATTPGYHWLLAGVDRVVSDDLRVLRVTGLLFTLALLAVLAVSVGRRARTIDALAMCLPLGASLYFFSSGAWLLPDNAAWLGVLLIVLLVFDRAPTRRSLLLSGVVLLALVFVRQSHIWTAALIWLWAWLGPETGDDCRLLPQRAAWPRRVRRTIPAILVTLPAFAAVAYFFWLWGGPIPPMFQGEVQKVDGPNFAVPVIVLATCGAWGVFYAGYWLPAAWRTARDAPRRALLIGASAIAIGALAALLPQTSFSIADGRFSGLWNVVRAGPDLSGRSLLMLAMALLGAGVCGCIGLAVPRRDAWLALGVLTASTAALTANAFAWQRYCEPLVLMLLPILCARIERAHGDGIRRFAPLGPVALAILLAAITAKAFT